MKAKIITIFVISTMLSMSTISSAESYYGGRRGGPIYDDPFMEIFRDVFYGAAVGAMVGGALMAFTKKPADHLNNLGYGAAAGVLVGATYGLARSSRRSFAEVENGNIHLAIPTVVPEVEDSTVRGQKTAVAWNVSLLHCSF